MEEASSQSSTAAAYNNDDLRLPRKSDAPSAPLNSSFLTQQRQSHINSSHIIKTVIQYHSNYSQASQTKMSPYENAVEPTDHRNPLEEAGIGYAAARASVVMNRQGSKMTQNVDILAKKR